MEILLLEDIAGIGKKNDLVQVGDGFALNNLLPRRAALVATPLVRRRYAELIRRRAEDREREKAMQAGAAQAISGKTVTFVRKASKAGKLYGSITEKNIAESLKDQHGIEVAPEAIVLAEHIKAVGTFPVTIKLAGNDASLSVVVTAEAEKKAA
jgi:large subunit ribosomal protein L9